MKTRDDLRADALADKAKTEQPQGWKLITVQLTPKAYGILRELCAAERRSQPEIIEDAILEYAANHARK